MYNNNHCLPPNCAHQPLIANLNVAFQSLLLNQSKPIIVKIQFWGQKQSQYLQLMSSINYNVHTTTKKFTDYLRDMQGIKVLFLDSRNNQDIGYTYINFLMYLRKDYEIDGGPFFVNEFQVDGDIQNNKKKKIGECKFKIAYKPYDKKQEQKKPFEKQIYERSNNPQNKNFSSAINQKIGSQNNFIGSPILSKNQSKVSENMIDFPYQFGIKKPETYANAQMIQNLNLGTSKIPKSNYEFQIMQLKLQENQLLNKVNTNQIPKSYHIEIYSFTAKNKQIKKKNTVDLCLGVTIYKTAQIKKHIKIYPVNEQGKFQSAILAEMENLIQITLIKDGKQEGIGKIEVKKIINAKSKQLELFKKQLAVGTVKLIYRSSTPHISHQVDQDIIPTKLYNKIQQKKNTLNKSKQLYEQPKKESKLNQLKPTNIREKYMLITISNAITTFPSKFLLVVLNQTSKWQSTTSKKSTLIIDLQETKTLLLEAFTEAKNIGQQVIPLHQYIKIPIVEHNLKCMMVFDEWIQIGQAKVALSMQIGTMKQINKTLNSFQDYTKLKNQQKIPQRQDKINLITENISKSQQNYSQRFQDYIIKDQKFRQKKQYTESNPRVETNPISELNRQSHSKNFILDGKKSDIQSDEQKPVSQVSNNQQFFLVDLLSKGLHLTDYEALKRKIYEDQTKNKTIEQFKRLWVKCVNQQSDNEEKKEDNEALVQILIDMFINQQQNQVDIQELLKCLQSYHNFVDLWWSYREDTLSSLQTFQPNIKEKIKKKSVLGVIKYSTLFDIILKNVPHQLKRSIEKYYHISTNSPLYTENFFQDLQAFNTGVKRIPIQSTPTLVEDLSRIIKETLEQLIQVHEDYRIDYQQVNLRTIGLIMQDLGIKISLWEGLLLIQELKNYYNTDSQFPQGVISSKTLKQWLVSLEKKSPLVQPQKDKNRQIKQSYKQKISPKIIQQQPQQKVPIASPQNKITQNHKFNQKNSSEQFQNNESDVFQIANLLRENDQMQLHTISMTNPIQKQNQGFEINKQKPHDMQILQDISKSELSQSISEQGKQIKKYQPQWKYVQFEIKEVKIKEDYQQQFLEVSLKFEPQNKKIIYIKTMSDLQGKILWEKIDFKSTSHSSQGFSITFSRRQSQEILFHGLLPIDDVLFVQSTKQKTLVLYGGSRNIVGKVSVIIRVYDKLPDIPHKVKQQKIELQVVIDYIEPSMQVRICSMEQVLIEICTVKQKYKIELKGQIYEEKLIIEDDEGLLQCIIPLEELFFKSLISGQYPMINTLNGQFVGQIHLTITNLKSHQLQFYQSQQIHQNKQFKAQQKIANKLKNQKKFYLFLDELFSFNYETSLHHSFVGCFYFKKPVHNQIIYKSNTFQHEIDYQSLSVTNIKETYLQINANQNLVITFQYEGKILAEGLLQFQQENIKGRLTVPLKTNIKNLVFRIHLRVLEFMSTNYSLNRILKSLCEPNISYIKNLPQGTTFPDVLNEIKNFNKLTLTQMQLIQELLKINKRQNIFCQVNQKIDYNNQLIQEFLFRDRQKKGFLPKKAIEEINALLKIQINCKDKSLVDYIDLIRSMRSNSIQLVRTQQAFKQIDTLHAQISKKYGYTS